MKSKIRLIMNSGNIDKTLCPEPKAVKTKVQVIKYRSESLLNINHLHSIFYKNKIRLHNFHLQRKQIGWINKNKNY